MIGKVKQVDELRDCEREGKGTRGKDRESIDLEWPRNFLRSTNHEGSRNTQVDGSRVVDENL